ncbi:hypothetical protein FUA23_02995 [Neolewinella aurantiaca]|uniref:Lipoprotein n=1 Tax=Neolewinella aurantiaca TaxID=2602767 RepID=A0A5C7G0I3_9BACT|nr:hypothetical protein [Neolewinella aurantiaca]TXF91205.1 hypothetical protein FUA23_02995 [Neolewinella aurantiaca]
MRATISALLLLILTACGPTPDPEPVAPPPTPTDKQVTGDPVVDSIRTEQARIEELFTTGMLQQQNVMYNCDGLMGIAELHKKDGQVVLVRNRYDDGENRIITDRFYYKDSVLIHQFSETLRWEFDGTTRPDQNGNEVPGITNYLGRYRYYIQDGKVVKFLKRKFVFSSFEPEPAEESFPLEEATPPSVLPYRSRLAQSAIDDSKVDCSVFK